MKDKKMNIKTSNNKYGIIRKINHWLVATIFIGLLILGVYMTNFDDYDLYGIHKSFGVILLICVLIRVIWLQFDTKIDNSNLTKVERIGSASIHGSLYILMFVIPISGMLMSMAYGHGIHVFNWFTIPMLIEKNEAVFHFFGEVHEISAYLAIILLVGHIGAALFHKFIKKDDILNRML
jgi:cytochrome b561